jgi:hypothetical protein
LRGFVAPGLTLAEQLARIVLNPAPESSKTRHQDVLIQSLGPVTKAATGDCADAKDQSGSALAFIIMGRALNWGQGALGSMHPYSHTVVTSVSGGRLD